MVSPACHREPVVELFVSHSKDPNYLTILEALQCDEHILRCWDILPPHGALVTVFFQDRDTCKGFVFQGEYRCAREMVWGMCRSLQFLEITTLDELAFPPPHSYSLCVYHHLFTFEYSPHPHAPAWCLCWTISMGLCFLLPQKEESKESESQLKIHCLHNVSSGAGTPRARAACCAYQYVPAGIQHKHCILPVDSTDKITLCT